MVTPEEKTSLKQTDSTGKVLVNKWAKVKDFNPLSSQQVLEYLRYKGYKIPRDRVTRKETTGKDSLAKLIKQHPMDPMLRLVLEARHLSKAIGYLDDSRVGRDGRFHPTYTFAPDTGRLASINPNFQNQPKHGVDQELADAIRETIIPSPGFVLVELDWKAIEAVLTGWFAGDAGFQRLSLLDSHSYLGWHILHRRSDVGPPPDIHDPRLGSLLADFKKAHPKFREIAKKVNHATSYGMGPKHLSEVLECTITEAGELLRIKDESSPLVAKWKKTIQQQAHKEGFLENPFGYRRYFFEVYKKDARGEWVLGSEARKALAFLPQSTAAGMLRATLGNLPRLPGYCRDWYPLVPIHDAIVLEVPEGQDERWVPPVRALMEKDWAELGGLSIKTDVKIGSNWAHMKDW
jgi:DNA polymerase-1